MSIIKYNYLHLLTPQMQYTFLKRSTCTQKLVKVHNDIKCTVMPLNVPCKCKCNLGSEIELYGILNYLHR